MYTFCNMQPLTTVVFLVECTRLAVPQWASRTKHRITNAAAPQMWKSSRHVTAEISNGRSAKYDVLVTFSWRRRTMTPHTCTTIYIYSYCSSWLVYSYWWYLLVVFSLARILVLVVCTRSVLTGSYTRTGGMYS